MISTDRKVQNLEKSLENAVPDFAFGFGADQVTPVHGPLDRDALDVITFLKLVRHHPFLGRPGPRQAVRHNGRGFHLPCHARLAKPRPIIQHHHRRNHSPSSPSRHCCCNSLYSLSLSVPHTLLHILHSLPVPHIIFPFLLQIPMLPQFNPRLINLLSRFNHLQAVYLRVQALRAIVQEVRYPRI